MKYMFIGKDVNFRQTKFYQSGQAKDWLLVFQISASHFVDKHGDIESVS